ncbi:hypothetical protein MCEHALHM7_00834 [Methylophilaceae bacterium]
MQKILILLAAIIICGDSYAESLSEEILLSCKIKKRIYGSSDNKITRLDISEFFLIAKNPVSKDISITPQSDSFQLPEVSTVKKFNTKLIKNLSSETVFHIINDRMDFDEKTPREYEIKINRLTGQIYTRNTYTIEGDTFNHIGEGNCEKVDMKKKSF